MPDAISWLACVCRQACRLTFGSFNCFTRRRHSLLTEAQLPAPTEEECFGSAAEVTGGSQSIALPQAGVRFN